MKVNLQKIITVISLLFVTIPIFSIVVYADLESDVDFYYKTGKEVYVDTTAVCESYCNGDLTFNEAVSSLVTISENAALSGLDYEANKVTSLINTFNRSFGGSEHGGGSAGGSRQPITDIWNDICGKNNVPTETTQTSTTDIGGYGALAVMTWVENGKERKDYYYYCDYIIVYDDDNSYLFTQKIIDKGHYKSYSNGKLVYDYNVSSSSTFPRTVHNGNYTVSYYGDVRYQDGTPAPTDDDFEYGTLKKFNEMTDKDLAELLDDFQTKLENENPDLDEIEDILKAIYWKLKQQDDNSVTNDDLNNAIDRLISAINKGDCACADIYKLIKDYDFGGYFGKIELLKTLLLSKFSFIENIKTFVMHCFNQYKNTSESPAFDIMYNGMPYTIDFNAFNDFLPTIRFILAGYIYITYAYHTYRKIPSYINGGDNE